MLKSRLITIVTSVGISCFLVEVVLRIFDLGLPPSPAQFSSEFLEYSPALFSRTVFPQREQRIKNIFSSTDLYYYVNSQGYRGKAFATSKLPGSLRIAVFGGSSVFDIANSDPFDWPHRLETILQAKGFSNVEVINAGVPGSASFDCVGRLFAEGHWLLSQAHYQLARLPEALAAARRVLELDPSHLPARSRVAELTAARPRPGRDSRRKGRPPRGITAPTEVPVR